jgi:hypothetical protein
MSHFKFVSHCEPFKVGNIDASHCFPDTSARPKKVEELFLAASRYDITDLKMKAAQELLNMMNPQNVAYALAAFDGMNQRELKQSKGLRDAALRLV